MRFDDSLQTVMAADTSSAFGAQSAFRQLVDLIGRRRIPAEGEALARLRSLAPQVPVAVRAAAARALALADPPAALVGLFADDEPAVAAPVLRAARLTDDEWLALLPRVGPAGRALLRGRTGLSDAVRRGLAAFGSTDFTIGHDGAMESLPEERVSEVVKRAPVEPAPSPPATQTFAIADLVQRIESFQQVRERRPATAAAPPDRFAFEADADDVIAWTDAPARSQLIGRTLVREARTARRAGAARIDITGTGELAGGWRAATAPTYAPRTGRFLGHTGVARREAVPADPPIEPDAMRRLVHELRTPTNAIAGFAELIETELLGPADPAYRTRAGTIGAEVHRLIGAIEDLEVSARVDGGALDLAPQAIVLEDAVTRAIGEVGAGDRISLAARSTTIVTADARVLDRLLTRLAGMVAGAFAGEATIRIRHAAVGATVIWPWSPDAGSTSLLGSDFTLRLAYKLARALGGRLIAEAGCLTLHLPTAFNDESAGEQSH